MEIMKAQSNLVKRRVKKTYIGFLLMWEKIHRENPIPDKVGRLKKFHQTNDEITFRNLEFALGN